MKHMIIPIILTTLCFFWLADTVITFSPFTFECKRLWHAVGMFMLIIGVAITNGSAYNRGYTKGAADGATALKDAVIKMLEDKSANETADN